MLINQSPSGLSNVTLQKLNTPTLGATQCVAESECNPLFKDILTWPATNH
jgi:hypothetical protein